MKKKKKNEESDHKRKGYTVKGIGPVKPYGRNLLTDKQNENIMGHLKIRHWGN